MGKGVVKLGDGNWAVKDGNLLATKQTNGRFKNTEFTVTRGTRATYVGRDGLIKESDLQNTNLVQNNDFEDLGSELVDFPNASMTLETGWSFTNNILTQDGSGSGSTADVNFSNNSFDLNKQYKFTITVSSYTSGDLHLLLNPNTNVAFNINGTGEFTVYGSFALDNNLHLRAGYGNFVGSVSNLSIKQVDPNDKWTLLNTTIEDGVLNFPDNSSAAKYAINSNASMMDIGGTYEITLTVNKTAGGALKVLSGTGGSDLTPAISISSSGTHTFTATNNTNGNRLFLYTTAGQNFQGTVDNVSVQEVKTATPRIDFTNNTDGHLLLEPARTNLLTYSENLATNWTTYSNTLPTDNEGVSPAGTNNATLVQKNGQPYARIEKSISLSNNTYTFSVFAKKGITDWIKLRTDGSSVNEVAFDLNNGVGVQGSGAPSYNIENAGNGWYKCSMTATTSITIVRLYVVDVNGGWGNTNDASAYFWGAQLEEGAYLTSYIPTYGATATRSTDTCINSGTVADFNSTEGVLFAEMAALANADATNPNRGLGISSGSTNNTIFIYFQASTNQLSFILISGGTTQFSGGTTSFDVTSFNKIALKYKQNDFALWVNGNQIATDTSGSAPAGLSELAFDNGAGNDKLFGKIKQLEVYKTGFSDDQLIRLTGTLGTHFYESYASMAGALTYTIQ